MTVLALDIETIPHPDNPAPEPRDGDKGGIAAAPHHRIVAAAGLVLKPIRDGRALISYEAVQLVHFGREATERSELAIVEHIARALNRESPPKLVTYNGDGFDLRVIWAAAMEHGIQIQRLMHRDVTYRYGTDGHEDMKDTLSQFGAARLGRQDGWARRIGLPGKMGVDGGDVKFLYAEGRMEELERYNASDVAQLAGIFLRHVYVAGWLSLDGYRASAASLVVLCETTPGLKSVVEHERFDRTRFLLTAA